MGDITMTSLSPVEKSDRIISLDVMRGFSLLGIFIINMISFHSPFLYADPYTWWQHPNDKMFYPWIDVFVQASFYPLFAMMFGYGLAIQQRRSSLKGTSFYPMAVRRLLGLLVIGCIHAFVIWSGDILINYALFGFLLLLFMKLSGKVLLWIGGLTFILPQLFFSILLFLVSLVDETGVTHFTDIQALQSSVQAYGSGSIQDIFMQRWEDWYNVNGPANIFFLMLSILPMLLIGAGAGKLQLLEQVKNHRIGWGITLIVAVILGISIKSLPILVEPNLAYSYIQDFFGGPFLSVSYAAILALLLINKKITKWFRPLAAAGRMSLTNYLLQSVVGTLIFYSYGLGLYGRVTLITGTLLAIGIFVMQVILSEMWLAKFKQGPVEKAWRMFTYGRKRPVKERDI
jgi:uncharacterized protein